MSIIELQPCLQKSQLASEQRLIRRARQIHAIQDAKIHVAELKAQIASMQMQLNSWHAWYWHRHGDTATTTLDVPAKLAKRVCVQAQSLVLHHADAATSGVDSHHARNSTSHDKYLRIHRWAGIAKHHKVGSDPWWDSCKDPWSSAVSQPAGPPSAA